MSALAVENEGLEFYSRAAKVASDPRARAVFLEMAQSRQEDIRHLTETWRELIGRDLSASNEDQIEAGASSIYPMELVNSAVCFVCGEEVPVDALPEDCPSCGASRYTFEMDIDEEAARRMVRRSERKRLDHYRRLLDVAADPLREPLSVVLKRGEESLHQLERRVA